jgi:ABC-type Zn uptake system ZnuABC Zn-binding protein ZnuA
MTRGRDRILVIALVWDLQICRNLQILLGKNSDLISSFLQTREGGEMMVVEMVDLVVMVAMIAEVTEMIGADMAIVEMVVGEVIATAVTAGVAMTIRAD